MLRNKVRSLSTNSILCRYFIFNFLKILEKQKQEVAIIQLKSEELKKQKKLEKQAEREKKKNAKRPDVNVEKEEVSWGVLSDDYLLNPTPNDWIDGNG